MNSSKPFYLFKNKWFTLFMEHSGVISPEKDGPIWVLFYGCYMHCNHSLPKLLWEAATEYMNEKHLA